MTEKPSDRTTPEPSEKAGLEKAGKDRADQTRERILRAAIREFSEHGLAGARTDSIAEEAKVNKALLYYYFRSKATLYAAALEDAATRVAQMALSAAEHGATPGERFLRMALNHYDRIASQHEFQNLMQQEMVRFHRGESESLPRLAQVVFQPVMQRALEAVCEGIKSGELCSVDPLQVIYSAFGANVFYFLSAPIMRLTAQFEPYDPAVVAERRNTAIQFLGSALFVDRKHGADVATHVLQSVPMPEVKKNPPAWRKTT
jgi:TetR/AcrR family transcriptional regulator